MSRGPNFEGEDRRRDTRVGLKIPVDYSSVDDFFSEFSANINEGGVFVEMEKSVELDTEVQLQFQLPGEREPIRVEGRVAWTSRGTDEHAAGVGIEFQNLPAEMREAIDRVVRRLRS